VFCYYQRLFSHFIVVVAVVVVPYDTFVYWFGGEGEVRYRPIKGVESVDTCGRLGRAKCEVLRSPFKLPALLGIFVTCVPKGVCVCISVCVCVYCAIYFNAARFGRRF